MRILILCLAFAFGIATAPHASAQSFPMGGAVHGQIRWMLVRSPNREQQSSIGARGTEFLEGVFTDTGALMLHGTRLEDPHHILAVDDYRLVASLDGHYIVGITGENGAWQGRLNLTRGP